jgi:hypothetical protein
MTLEQDCIAVLATQMGPAARVFLQKQCRAHLNKEPSALQKSDLNLLADWCAAGTQSILGAAVAENVRKGILALK